MSQWRYRVVWRVVFVWVATTCAVLPVHAKYSGGTGEPNDPYQIATAADLIAMGNDGNDYAKHFILTADIDLDPNLPGGRGFNQAVIGYFAGVFDGKDHAISHLTIRGAGYLGLFGQLTETDLTAGEIRNLRLEDVSIVASGGDAGTPATPNPGAGDHVGALAARNNGVSVTHVSSSGKVTGEGMVGGLVGYNGGTVTYCHSTCTVTGNSDVGGLVGCNNGTLSYSHAAVAVAGAFQVGGLVGCTYWGRVTQCCSDGVVDGDYAVGGLVGQNGVRSRADLPGYVDRSYSTARVSGGSSIGGLVGENYYGPVTQCYSTGAVAGSASVGGLVGTGLAREVTACFWDVDTSGVAVSMAGEGKTTAQMQMVSTFLNAGWDFAGEVDNGPDDIWRLPEGGGYPVLTAFTQTPSASFRGQGTREAPYLISNAAELKAMAHGDPNAHYRLTASLDLSGVRFTTEIIPRFAGVFDGAGHTISRVAMTGTGYLGLFGVLDAGAEVMDLGIVDIEVKHSGSHAVAGLARLNMGTVTRCYVSGAVTGRYTVGGLVAQNEGTVTCSSSTASVSGFHPVGGLVAHNAGTVTQCYSVGRIGDDSITGGLVGVNELGAVVSQSFWNTETSGRTTSAGGTGKTTAEMQTAQTFLDAGWDFVGETANGTEDVWWIEEGKDYPHLSWETTTR